MKCDDTVHTWDWEDDYYRRMCDYCYEALSEEDKEKVDSGTYTCTVENSVDTLSFISFLSSELCLDEQKVLNKYNEWRKMNE